MLEAIFPLPISPEVQLHSLIGTGRVGKLDIPHSDGVVPVNGAHHPHVFRFRPRCSS